KELSANALQEHFTLPYAGQPPIPLSIPMDAADKAHGQTAYDREDVSGGMGLLTPEGPAVDAEEEAFIRAMKRKKKKKRKGLGL
ncbi:relaxase, partial [Phocaeicola dorei]|nr:relaxase [Phocaeicola dorei]MCG4639907.1 relaxase [Phocaeicola dorei]